MREAASAGSTRLAAGFFGLLCFEGVVLASAFGFAADSLASSRGAIGECGGESVSREAKAEAEPAAARDWARDLSSLQADRQRLSTPQEL